MKVKVLSLTANEFSAAQKDGNDKLIAAAGSSELACNSCRSWLMLGAS